MVNEPSQPYLPWYFRREDESADPLFYTQPRLVVHIDDYAIGDIGDYLGRVLPQNSMVLDLFSSWRSHLPEGFARGRMVGLGLNAVEMHENPQLDEQVVQDVNADQTLPFSDATFDAAVITVSIQYVTKPVEVFREVNRVLKAGASFHVIYSNRMFPTKAVLIWREMDDAGHARLVRSYFDRSDSWEGLELLEISPLRSFYTDPVYVAVARKKGVASRARPGPTTGSLP